MRVKLTWKAYLFEYEILPLINFLRASGSSLGNDVELILIIDKDIPHFPCRDLNCGFIAGAHWNFGE